MNAPEVLKRVSWLECVGDPELERLLAGAAECKFQPGESLIAELELGEELYILLDGTARVTIASERGEPKELGSLCAGDACGEISLLSRGLHSATATATTPVVALRLPRPEFERIVSRHPAIAVHFAKEISRRVVEMDRLLDELLSESDATAAAAIHRLSGRTPAVVPARASIRRAWRELVLSRRRELPFFALAAFVVTLLAVRLGARWLEHLGVGLFAFLRAAYSLGILLVFISTAVALVRFRPRILSIVSIVYGAGFALILNELSVFLAFDIFYLDMTTPDPALILDVEALYRRSESAWAIALMIAFLAQLTFLRGFYRRSLLVIRARWAALLRGRRVAQT